MNQVNQLKKLASLSYFKKNSLSQVVSGSDNALYTNIKRWIKKGDLIQLKRGLYVTPQYCERLFDKSRYSEFLANKLREPSYLSLEYVLQKHGILTDAVYAFTSVTLKIKQRYENRFGVFLYRNINEKLFTGFCNISTEGYQILEATKAKALFDYLYFKLLRVKNIDDASLISLRLNLDNFSSRDWNEFSRYCRDVNVKKFETLSKKIRGAYDQQRS